MEKKVIYLIVKSLLELDSLLESVKELGRRSFDFSVRALQFVIDVVHLVLILDYGC